MMKSPLVIVPIAMLSVAVLLVILSLISYLSFQRNAKDGMARLIQLPMQLNRDVYCSPFMEMEVDGRIVTIKAQPARVSMLKQRLGENVQVQYVQKKVFGKSVWKLYITEQGMGVRPSTTLIIALVILMVVLLLCGMIWRVFKR